MYFNEITPEHSNRPHNPTGTVFWSTSSIHILSRLCLILTTGKVNKKWHKTLASVLCDTRKRKLPSLRFPSPRLQRCFSKSRQTHQYDGSLLTKKTGKLNKKGSNPILLPQVSSPAVKSLGPLVQDKIKSAANPSFCGKITYVPPQLHPKPSIFSALWRWHKCAKDSTTGTGHP